jgi:hypothetical protein
MNALEKTSMERKTQWIKNTKQGHQWLTPVILDNLGGRDQEDRSSKPAQGNSSQDSISKKNPLQKTVDGMAQDVGPEFKLQCRQ